MHPCDAERATDYLGNALIPDQRGVPAAGDTPMKIVMSNLWFVVRENKASGCRTSLSEKTMFILSGHCTRRQDDSSEEQRRVIRVPLKASKTMHTSSLAGQNSC